MQIDNANNGNSRRRMGKALGTRRGRLCLCIAKAVADCVSVDLFITTQSKNCNAEIADSVSEMNGMSARSVRRESLRPFSPHFPPFSRSARLLCPVKVCFVLRGGLAASGTPNRRKRGKKNASNAKELYHYPHQVESAAVLFSRYRVT